jgi:hypothetical protein
MGTLQEAWSLAKRAAGSITQPFSKGIAYMQPFERMAVQGKNAGKMVAKEHSLEGLADAMFTTNKKGMFTGSEIMKDGVGTGKYWDYGAMAKTASGLAIGWRFATGGGIYRDKNGNFDVAGVPFI